MTMLRLSELLGNYHKTVTSGERPPSWSAGPLFEHLVLAPRRVLVLAGPPGSGKSALILQWLVEALTRNEDLTCYLANVEMDPTVLLHRLVARQAQINLHALMGNSVTEQDVDRLSLGLEALAKIGDRLIFAEPPFEFGRIVDELENIGAQLACIDYIQRVPVDDSLIKHTDDRTRLDGLMSACRDVARQDRCILVVSAIGRTKNGKGQVTHGDHVNYANLRGSSELEFAPDDVAILVRKNEKERNEDTWTLTLKHEKGRNGGTQDKTLWFHRTVQTFGIAPGGCTCRTQDDDWSENFEDEDF
jgi:replicative DNA helicase